MPHYYIPSHYKCDPFKIKSLLEYMDFVQRPRFGYEYGWKDNPRVVIFTATQPFCEVEDYVGRYLRAMGFDCKVVEKDW
jgi:hypothetical protein